MHDLLVPERATEGLIQYQNVGKVHPQGIAAEISGRPASWVRADLSYAFQRATNDVTGGALANSPMHLAKLRFAVPAGRILQLSSAIEYSSARLTLADAWVTPVMLAGFTVTPHRLTRNVDFQFGIRNALARAYSDPVALSPLVDTMPQPARSFYLRVHRNVGSAR